MPEAPDVSSLNSKQVVQKVWAGLVGCPSVEAAVEAGEDGRSLPVYCHRVPGHSWLSFSTCRERKLIFTVPENGSRPPKWPPPDRQLEQAGESRHRLPKDHMG